MGLRPNPPPLAMHPDDAPLRAAIAAAPDAALPRLVYADFLDDHDFPHHAASLRLDAALAAEKPWADRYWHLLDDRRRHTPADGWPGDLGWLADRQPLLCGVPDDWRSRWRAVRAFVSRWWDVPLGDAGLWAEVSDLPPAVREWEVFAPELAEANEEAFRDPFGLARVPGQPALSLLEQAEGDVHWAVWDADLAAADPPVHAFMTDYDDGDRFVPEGGRFADTVAGFALFYLLSYRVDMRDAADHPATRAALAAEFPHAGRFDQADVFEGPSRAAVLLPPGLPRFGPAQLFRLTD